VQGTSARGRFTATAVAVSTFASLLILVAPPTPAGSQVPSRPEVGVNLHVMWSDWTGEQRSETLQKMADAGMEWIRIDFAWASLQPDGPNDYSSWIVEWAERYAAEAHAHGMKVLATFWNTPGWANGGAGRDVPPDDPADFARAAEWVSTRLRNSVDAWEVWNEANLDSFFSGTPSEYVELLKVAYPALKAGDPEAPVISTGTSYTDYAWLAKMYDAGAQGYFDVLAVHPYMAPADLPPETENGEMWTISAVQKVRDLMRARGDVDKPIWFTEFAWSAHGNEYASCKEVYNNRIDIDPNDGVGCSDNGTMGVTEKLQAEYFVRAIKYVQQKNETHGWGVTNMIWYNARNKNTKYLHENNFGLLYRDLTPKSVYFSARDYLTQTTPYLPDAPDAGPPGGTDPDASEEPDPAVSDPGDEEGAPVARENLLPNGDFESGLRPWKARKGRAYLVDNAFTGARAGLVRGRRRSRALVSGFVRLAEPTVLEAAGHVRVPRAGQRIRLVLVERRDGRRIGRWRLVVSVRSRGWVDLPTLRYLTQGDSSVRVKVRMRSRRARYFWADGMRLVAR
jgi:hypothetical protein